MGNASNWSRVYWSNDKLCRYAFAGRSPKQIYDEYCQENREYYKQIPKEAYANIEKCVEDAIEHGNHAAFVHYFIQCAKFPKDRFAEQLEEYIAHWKEQFQANEKQMKLLRVDFWRSPGFCCKREDLDRYVYRPGMLSEWKGRSSSRTPEKDVIVQMGLYFQLNYSQVNQLLLLAGREQLYILDAADAVAMFYLNFYETKPVGGIEELYGRILQVQNQIYGYLHKNTSPKRKLVNKKVKKAPGEQLQVLLYSEKIGWNIDQEIEEYRSRLEASDRKENSPEGQKQWGKTDYLTHFAMEQYGHCDTEESFYEFLKQGEAFIFQKRYGYLHKTRQFFMGERGYEKNRWGLACELTKDGWRAEECLRDDRWDITGSLKRQKGTAIVRIRAIWELKNMIEEFGVTDTKGSNGGYSLHTSLNMIEGRERLKEKEYSTPTSAPGEKAYEFWLKSKVQVARLCLAAGYEDELPRYLMLAGYWRQDWYSMPPEKEQYDKTDSLLLYALNYRDALIAYHVKKWEQRNPERSADEFRRKLKMQFPMVALFMTINRDIQFVVKDVLGKKVDMLKKYCNELVYPVLESDRHWFLGYEEILNQRKESIST